MKRSRILILTMILLLVGNLHTLAEEQSTRIDVYAKYVLETEFIYPETESESEAETRSTAKEETESESERKTAQTETPRTGDDSQPLQWLFLMLASAAALSCGIGNLRNHKKWME